MTARDRCRRLRVYAIATKRSDDALTTAHSTGYVGVYPELWPELGAARDRERHAYDRLPEHVQVRFVRP